MEFKFSATKRDVKGTGASRRLRRAGTTPAIIYGGTGEPVQISLDHNELFHSLRKEAFHASVLNIDVEGTNEKVILRNTQWHPFKQLVLHVDFQRVDATHKLHIKVPLHFLNEDTAPGVDKGAGVRALCAMLDIDPARVLAIGDNDNDIPMLEAVGFGIAMGESSAGLRAVADWVAPSITEDGAAYALEKWVLAKA